jgi:predicted small integral membrane protein
MNIPSTASMFRLTKAVLVTASACMATLVVFGNITDYSTNFLFVKHVLLMDTTFANSELHYRSIHSPILFHLAYLFIIALELLMAFCCIKGSWLLFKHLRSDAEAFHAAKKWAVAGLLTGIITWLLGFEVIGGEWFAMWQSTSWNGLGSAERIVSFLLLTLILLQMKEG